MASIAVKGIRISKKTSGLRDANLQQSVDVLVIFEGSVSLQEGVQNGSGNCLDS
jgi:hypothetical protein